jgi:hypothetical protein
MNVTKLTTDSHMRLLPSTVRPWWEKVIYRTINPFFISPPVGNPIFDLAYSSPSLSTEAIQHRVTLHWYLCRPMLVDPKTVTLAGTKGLGLPQKY